MWAGRWAARPGHDGVCPPRCRQRLRESEGEVFMGQIRATATLARGLAVFYDAPLWAPNEGHSRFMAPAAITLQLIAAQLARGLPGTQRPARAGATHQRGFRLPRSPRHLRGRGASLVPATGVPRGEEGAKAASPPLPDVPAPGVGAQHVGSARGGGGREHPHALRSPTRSPPAGRCCGGAVPGGAAPSPPRRRLRLQRSRRLAERGRCSSRGSGPVRPPPRALRAGRAAPL